MTTWMVGEIVFPDEADGSLQICIADQLELLQDRGALFNTVVRDDETYEDKDGPRPSTLFMIHGRVGFHGGKVNLERVSPSTQIIFCTHCGFRTSFPTHVMTLQELATHFTGLGATYREIR